MRSGRRGPALTIAAALSAAVAAGCGGTTAPAPPAATSSASPGSPTAVTGPPPGQPTDYSFLLVKPRDIGGELTASQPPLLNPDNTPGATQLFANADKTRRVWDTVQVFADPNAATAELATAKATYADKVIGTWQPLGLGGAGALITGVSPDNAQAVTVVLFTEGRALGTLEFDGAPGDPVDPALATAIAGKQDDAIKKGLPG
ncbi:hypothetical protein A5714_06670 [Mycobacterium sp. E2462]|uniref:hypothetical protein n=1 Tax=Mycobacterium sp. E2462 TaxID=1834133 RepID=UPI0007FFC60A|nr:hypothetical protein [Mycobacterium sp. E2462]OBI22037.1 hypothetical protein A5714_06670 [Mycobacterium sp. E2462]